MIEIFVGVGPNYSGGRKEFSFDCLHLFSPVFLRSPAEAYTKENGTYNYILLLYYIINY